MIKHSNPTITNKTLRKLLADELRATHRAGGAVYGDSFFLGFRYGLYNAYERVQLLMNLDRPDRMQSLLNRGETLR
jgi:hypothetical protein